MSSPFSSNGSRAIDLLKAGYSMEMRRRVLLMPNGGELEFFCTPVTLEQRARARKDARSDDAADFAISLLILKARSEGGEQMFNAADAADLRRLLPADAIEKLIDLMLSTDLTEDEEEVLVKTSPKHSRSSLPKMES
jgi:hypothetical protein